jgi:tetratricopeptide (TPR) repeat protein
VCAWCLRAPSALAQPSPSDEAFLEGKALMDQGRTAEACAKFAESLAIDRRGGTLLNLAVCREKEGRYATAVRLLFEARDRAEKDGRPDRIALADEHLKSAQRQVSWIKIKAARDAGAPDLSVRCDGEPVPPDRWGVANALDPGPHTITATAAGRVTFETSVLLGSSGEERTVEIPPLARVAPIEPPPLAATAQHAEATPPATHWRKPLGGVLVGLGSASIVVGSAFGVKAIVDVRDANPECPKSVCRTMGAAQQEANAQTEARVADITLPIGAVLAGAGLYFLLARRSPASAAAASVVTVAPLAGSTRGLALIHGW